MKISKEHITTSVKERITSLTRADAIRAAILGVFILIVAGALYWANYDKPGYYTDSDSGMLYETARVLEVLEDNTTIDETTENIRRGSMDLKLEILSGEYKGDIAETTNYFSSLYNVYVTEGDKVTVRLDITSGNYTVSVYNYYRTGILMGFVIFFFLAIALVGGKQGVKSIIGLVFTLVSVIFLLVPAMMKGMPAIPTTVVILTISTIACFLLIGGIQRKTAAAAAGTVLGVIFAAVLATITGVLASVTGFHMDEAESLLLIATDTELQISGLFISGVLIASVGAVMDIAMTIASSVEELHINSPHMKQRELFRSGMTIGRDAMGTMANTLILAFAGSSLNMIIMIYSYGVTFTQLINTDFIAIEVIRSIAGSMGIVFCVPAVSFIAAWISLADIKVLNVKKRSK